MLIFVEYVQICKLFYMILSFSIQNFRSIKEKVTLSMLPVKGYQELNNNIVTVTDKIKALSSAVIYGANASGKSNVIKALKDFINFIVNSSGNKLNDTIKIHDPFLFDTTTNTKPSEFELEFLIDKVRYIYTVSCNSDKIITEHLTYYPKGQTVLLFKRENTSYFKFGIILKGEKKSIENRLLENQLYLSKAANENLDMLIDVYNWFDGLEAAFSDMSNLPEIVNMSSILGSALQEKDSGFFKRFESIITAFDLGIDSLKIMKNTRSKNLFGMVPDEAIDIFNSALFSEEIPELEHELFVVHKIISEDSGKVEYREFPLEMESAGTKNLMTMAVTLLEHFEKGTIMIIDEFERSLHSHIVTKLIQFFNDPDLNINHAQLIFSTHAVNLLDNNLFRRDQVWFTEKDENGATDLYSLSQVEGIRKDVPYDKWYLSGRFGATPVVNEPNLDFKDGLPKGN